MREKRRVSRLNTSCPSPSPTVSLTAYSSRRRRQNRGASVRHAYRRLHEELATEIRIADPVDGLPRVRDRFYRAVLPVFERKKKEKKRKNTTRR